MTTKLVQQLKDNKILDEFFSKSRIHKALVNRSTSLLKLLIIQKAITEEELAMIWYNCSLDEAIHIELYSVIGEIADSLEENHARFFVEKIAPRAKSGQLRNEEINFLEEMATKSIKRGQSQNTGFVLECLWSYLFENQSR
jgi:hypothetical protein